MRLRRRIQSTIAIIKTSKPMMAPITAPTIAPTVIGLLANELAVGLAAAGLLIGETVEVLVEVAALNVDAVVAPTMARELLGVDGAVVVALDEMLVVETSVGRAQHWMFTRPWQ